jgi:hypothetical protein
MEEHHHLIYYFFGEALLQKNKEKIGSSITKSFAVLFLFLRTCMHGSTISKI